jgi:hypothetical protein
MFQSPNATESKKGPILYERHFVHSANGGIGVFLLEALFCHIDLLS